MESTKAIEKHLEAILSVTIAGEIAFPLALYHGHRPGKSNILLELLKVEGIEASKITLQNESAKYGGAI